MKQKLVKLAKEAAKLLWIELVVPGGTLVVLAILLARGLAYGRPSRLTALFPAHITSGRPGSRNQFSTAEALQSVP